MIVGTGIDLIDVARVERDVSRQGDGFLDEIFSSTERADCAVSGRPAAGYAARFAAKEACFKALGTGKIGRMAWRDIEVLLPRTHEASVVLSGETGRVAAGRGVSRTYLAVATSRDVAVAWIVMTSGDTDDGFRLRTASA